MVLSEVNRAEQIEYSQINKEHSHSFYLCDHLKCDPACLEKKKYRGKCQNLCNSETLVKLNISKENMSIRLCLNCNRKVLYDKKKNTFRDVFITCQVVSDNSMIETHCVQDYITILTQKWPLMPTSFKPRMSSA